MQAEELRLIGIVLCVFSVLFFAGTQVLLTLWKRQIAGASAGNK